MTFKAPSTWLKNLGLPLPLLRLLLPQLAISSFVIVVYVGNLDLNHLACRVAFHLAELAILQTVFLIGWGALARTPWGENSPHAPRLFAFTLTGFLGGLNLLYFTQMLSVWFWASPLTLNILRALPPQIHSLSIPLGSLPSFALALIGLLCLSALALASAKAPALWRHLRLATTQPVRPIPLLSCLTIAAILASWSGHRAAWQSTRIFAGLSSDPLLSLFIPSSVAREVSPDKIAADLLARRNYPTGLPFHPRTVILITIDALRPDHLPSYGYPRQTTPFLSQLAATEHWQKVECAYSTSNASRYGLLSILTSRFPKSMHLESFGLPEVLQKQGYRTHAFLSGDHTTFQHLRRAYGDHFDLFHDGNNRPFPINDDRNVVDDIEHLPPSSGQPAFFWLHLMSVHELGARLPESARWKQNESELWNARIWGHKGASQAASDLYDNGILQADLHLERIFAALKAKGYLHDYLAVLTADHGQSLGEHGITGHWQNLYEPEVRIPMLFIESAIAPDSPMPFASQIDLAPTLLARLGLPLPTSWEGHSLLRSSSTPASLPEPSPPAFRTYLIATPPGKWRGVVDVRDGVRYKYLFDAHDPTHLQEHLFDLSADPDETRDLLGVAPQSLLDDLRRLAAIHFPLSRGSP